VIRRLLLKPPRSRNASAPVRIAGSLPPNAIVEIFRTGEILSIPRDAKVFLKRFYPTLAMLLWIGFPLIASSHGYQAGTIRIVHPWAMPTAASITDGDSGMGYLVLRNAGNQPDKLLSAHTEIARKIELHAHGKGGDIPTMRQVKSVAIPAGGEVRLEPGGLHLVLMGLKQPLEEGQHFPVVLQFERAGKITVDMFVQKNAKSSIY
jgi:hypothetical protein